MKKLNHYVLWLVYCRTHYTDPKLKCQTTKENRIYIRGEFTRKKCKTAILLYCFHTVYFTYLLNNLLGPGISFYRKSKINVKRKPNYEIGSFHNWPMIISHRLYSMPSTLQTMIFRYNYNPMMFFFYLIHSKVI